jgi:hypothetical protein
MPSDPRTNSGMASPASFRRRNVRTALNRLNLLAEAREPIGAGRQDEASLPDGDLRMRRRGLRVGDKANAAASIH